MIASPIYHRNSFRGKAAPTLLKYVSQRSLAVLLFIALALLASVGNKPSHSRESSISNKLSISESRDDHGPYLSLDPRQLFANIVRSIKDGFDDPALIEYAKEQGADIPDASTCFEDSLRGFSN